MTEQSEPLAQLERVGDRQGVGREAVEGVGSRIVGLVARAVPAMVERDHAMVAGEDVEVIGEVLLGPAEAVQEKETGARSGDAYLELDPVIDCDSHETSPIRRVPEPPRLREMEVVPRRPSGKFWVRLVVSVGILAFLLSRVDANELLPPDRDGTHLAFLALGLVATFVGIVASAWRWQRVLLTFDARPGLPVLTRYYLAGQFVGNVLPSTIGGDVVRISRCGKTVGSNETAFASVALERLTGFVALPIISLVGFLFTPSIMAWKRSWLALGIDAAALVMLGVILYTAGHPRAAGRFADRENWTRFIGAIHFGVNRLRHRPRDVLGILGTAFVYQVTVVVSVAFAAKALDVSVPTAALFAFVPVVAMAQVVPITVGGLGVREGLLVLFLGPFGVTQTQAVGLGLLWYGMLLLVSLLGAPAFAVGHREAATVGADNE